MSNDLSWFSRASTTTCFCCLAGIFHAFAENAFLHLYLCVGYYAQQWVFCIYMHQRITDVAQVISGHHFRERLTFDPQGNLSVIQMKDLAADREVTPSRHFARIYLSAVPERVAIQDGDLILRARGETYSGVLTRGRFQHTLIAAPLMLVRAHERVLLPGYLLWFINHPATQAQLAALATGTHVRTVSKPALEALLIPVPSLVQQREIVEFAALAAAEQALLTKISGSRRRLAEGILWRYVQDTR